VTRAGGGRSDAAMMRRVVSTCAVEICPRATEMGVHASGRVVEVMSVGVGERACGSTVGRGSGDSGVRAPRWTELPEQLPVPSAGRYPDLSFWISGWSSSGPTSNAMKSPRFWRPASCSFASTSSGEPTMRRSTSFVVRARSRRSSRTRPPFSVAASPSTATIRARKRSKTRSWRLRANSAPVLADERRRCSSACLKASGEA
jgi:hypothetical protein